MPRLLTPGVKCAEPSAEAVAELLALRLERLGSWGGVVLQSIVLEADGFGEIFLDLSVGFFVEVIHGGCGYGAGRCCCRREGSKVDERLLLDGLWMLSER